MNNLLDSLSPLERKVLPYLHLSVEQIEGKTGLDKTSVLRALRFLENKKIVQLVTQRSNTITLGVNGVYYKKNHLPERRLLLVIEKERTVPFKQAQEESGISDNEFKAALGVLKKKGLIEIVKGKLTLASSKEEVSRKLPDEVLLEKLPIEESKLSKEEQQIVKTLRERKDIIELTEKTEISIEITELGKSLQKEKLDVDLIEEVTPDLIKNWSKNKKFRRYDVLAPVPKIYGGKEHFVNEAREYARKIWLEMGFKEMDGPLVDTSFWVFDALFTAQDHPVREMQDSFFIKGKEGRLPAKELVDRVKQVHEHGVDGSEGWNYKWSEEEAKKVVLRTHTTSSTARLLASLKEKDLPAKYFSVGKAFRNETIDWSHGIEFHQTEGIVIGKDITLRHLLGYLIVFYKKMGFEKIRWRPSFFPYTEPSLEIDVYHEEKKLWLELGGAGMLRPEVTIPLFGKAVPAIAWGQGLDRMIMDYYKIKDLRELYSNSLPVLRKKKVWLR